MDTDYTGGDINVDTADDDKRNSAEECQALCSERPGCKLFTWDKGDNSCWLKECMTAEDTKADSVSGPATCTGTELC